MRDGELRAQLQGHLERVTAAPFLFVGSGLPRRYLGLPGWEALLRSFVGHLPHPYEYYSATAGGELPAVASLIADDFHPVWWSTGAFADHRNRTVLPAGRQSALKFEVAHLLALQSDLQAPTAPAATTEAYAEEIGLLRSAVIDGIITTNYDSMLSQIFPDFRVFVGQDQLLFSDTQGVAEIYHIHGSVAEPESLVLTAEDYARFETRDAYLAAKLLTVFVEHPVIFLGYSLSDPNVTGILRAIAACLTSDNISQLADRLLFVEWDGRLLEPEMGPSTVVIDGIPLPVISIRANDYRPIFETLASLHRPFPARVLRHLREHVYNLVLNPPEEAESVYVESIDSGDAGGLRVVFGVGRFDASDVADLGYRGVRREDLAMDVLGASARPLDARAVLQHALPQIAKQTPYVPVWKYLRDAGRVSSNGDVNTDGLDERVKRLVSRRAEDLYPSAYLCRRKARELPDVQTPAELEQLGLRELVDYAPLLPIGGYDPEQLRDALKRRFPDCVPGPLSTAYYKCVSLYDLVRFGPGSSTAAP